MPLTTVATRWLALGTLLLAASQVHAATIVGRVVRDSHSAAGLPVSLTCPGVPPATGSTDARGDYRLSINGSGRCTLQIGDATADVIVFNQAPMQYDFELQVHDGNAKLVRR
jgi:hypothetical protein